MIGIRRHSHRQRSEAPTFTAHNIELPDGTQTKPGFEVTANSGVCQAALRTLRVHFSEDEIPETSLVDLGCLEGGYSAAFAQAGFKVTGVEVRDLNMAKCRYVEQRLQLDHLRFLQADVRQIADIGPFDAVFCCGLLYHLDHPRAFLETLAQCTRRMLILQTHFTEDRVPAAHAANLSEMTMHEGNLGRWYREYPDDATPQQIADAAWASWGNPRSFWIEKKHLLNNLLQVGFSSVYEQFDYLADVVTDTFPEDQGRGMFVAVKDQCEHRSMMRMPRA